MVNDRLSAPPSLPRCLLRLEAGRDIGDTLGREPFGIVVAGWTGGRAALVDGMRSGAPRGTGPLILELGDLASATFDTELDASLDLGPEGFLVDDDGQGLGVQALGAKLAVREAERGIEDGRTWILARAGSSAASVPQPQSYRRAARRLAGILWDERRFAADLVADGRGAARLSIPALAARGAVAIAARAAHVPAFAVASGARGDALRAECRRARRDGFFGLVVSDPSQVAPAAEAFGETGLPRR